MMRSFAILSGLFFLVLSVEYACQMLNSNVRFTLLNVSNKRKCGFVIYNLAIVLRHW